MKFFYDNTINVFTDSSLLKDYNNTTSVCSGHVITLNGGILNYNAEVFYDTDNAYGEIYALYKGLDTALKLNRESYRSSYNINVFSDNEFAAIGCTKWIENWYNNGNNEFMLKNSSKKSVSYQEVFLDIINTVLEHSVPICILNVLAHQKPNNVASMDKFTKYFYTKNKIGYRLPIDKMQEICSFNNVVDNMTRSTLTRIINTGYFDSTLFTRKRMPCIYWYPKQEDIKNYLKLVNR